MERNFSRESVYYISKTEQKRLFRAFYEALEPGGSLVVIAFNGAMTTASWIIQKDHGIELAFNEISLRNLASSAGFSDIKIRGIKSGHTTPFGSMFSLLMGMYKNITSRLRYISERGLDSQNPRIFSKSIVLIAHKK